MKVVIEIPEDYYNAIKEIPSRQCTIDMLITKFGTPIPKGHDIVDGTELNKYFDDLIHAEQKIRLDGYETRADIVERIKIKTDTLTIVEAGREE